MQIPEDVLLAFETSFIICQSVRKKAPLLAYETDDCFSHFSLYGGALFFLLFSFSFVDCPFLAYPTIKFDAIPFELCASSIDSSLFVMSGRC